MSLYVKIRQMFQPYYQPKPKPPKIDRKGNVVKKKKKKKKDKSDKDKSENKSIIDLLFGRKKDSKNEDNSTERSKSDDVLEEEKSPVENADDTVLETDDYEVSEYERYVESSMYEYHRKLIYLINVNFIDFVEQLEKNTVRSIRYKEVAQEVSTTVEDMKSKKMDSVKDDVDDQIDIASKMVSRIGEQMTMPVIDKNAPFGDVQSLNKLPDLDTMWYYHDKMTHQVLGYFSQGSGYRNNRRSNALRRKLDPLIYPKTLGEPYDRTHLIPLGYHGSEGDSRLLIGWLAEHNRVVFNDFEQKQKARKQDIYWLTRVDRLPDYSGATWTFEIYDDSLRLIDELEVELKANFMWKSNP